MLFARIGSLADSLAVTVAERYIQVAAGQQFACALTDLGKTYCWGVGGALGSPKDSSAIPALVETSARFATIYASRSYACGLTGEGQAWCWGNVAEMAGLVPAQQFPTPVPTTQRFRRLGAGLFAVHGITVDSAHYWWGHVYNLFRPEPVLFDQSRRYVDASFNEAHGCVVASTRAAYCWGYNGTGQYGNGSYESAYVTLTPAFTGLQVLRAVVGVEHTCVLAADSTAYCAGQGGEFGTLGDGSTTAFTNQPRRVSISGRLRDIAAGNRGMCAITVAGSAYCWGAFIRLSSMPWLVVTPQRFVAVSVGNGSAYGLTARGELFAWGNNTKGQLGDGTTTSSEVPVRVVDPP